MSQVRDERKLPHLHQGVLVELVNFDPAIFPFPQPSGGNQGVQVRMEVQLASEGMGHHHYQPTDAVLQLQILLDYRGSECRQVMQQMPVAAKDWPENIGHSEVDTDISDIRQRSPLIPLPQCRCAMAATGASP